MIFSNKSFCFEVQSTVHKNFHAFSILVLNAVTFCLHFVTFCCSKYFMYDLWLKTEYIVHVFMYNVFSLIKLSNFRISIYTYVGWDLSS